MEQNLKVEKGEVIVFTKGEYSDFGLDGFLVFIRSCDLAERAQTYYNNTDMWEQEDFSAKLIADEYAVPVQYRSIHLGDYGSFQPEFGVKFKEGE